MSWISTPWLVGGGAVHSQEIARNLAYVTSGGGEGVVDAGDLKVSANTPNAGDVLVGPGSAIIRNRYVTDAQQSYTARNQSTDTVAIPSTSGSARIDLICARIEDPFVAGAPWTTPGDPTTATYIFTRVVSNVPASAIVSPWAAAAYLRAQGWSAIPLASVSLPASTATVTGAMIKDLRMLANPFSSSEIFNYQSSDTVAMPNATIVGMGSGEPSDGAWQTGFPAINPQFVTPEWCTHINVDVIASFSKSAHGAMVGEFRARFGVVGGENTTLSQAYWEMEANSQTVRFMAGTSNTMALPPADRGQLRSIVLDMRRWKAQSAAAPAVINFQRGCYCRVEVSYLRRPV